MESRLKDLLQRRQCNHELFWGFVTKRIHHPTVGRCATGAASSAMVTGRAVEKLATDVKVH
jgi:hypothetical protein